MADPDTTPIANACEVDFESLSYDDDDLETGVTTDSEKTLWALSFGAYGTTQVYVWTNGSDPDDAFEEAVDWLDDQGECHVFTTLDESDLRDAAQTLNIPWNPAWWPGGAQNDPLFDRVLEQAEVDLTIIGHTTLRNCGPGPHYIPNQDWYIDEITDEDEIRTVGRRSMQECHGHSFLPGDLVYVPADSVDDPAGAGKYIITEVRGDTLELENERYSHTGVEPSDVEEWDEGKHATLLQCFDPDRFKSLHAGIFVDFRYDDPSADPYSRGYTLTRGWSDTGDSQPSYDDQHPWFIPNFVGGTSLIGKANSLVLQEATEEAENDASVVPERCLPWFVQVTPGYGGGEPHFAFHASRTPEDIYRLLAGLENYPLLSDEKHSELQIEAQEEAWESWAREDYRRALVDAFEREIDPEDYVNEEFDVEMDDVSDVHLTHHFYEWSDAAGEYWEDNEDGSMWIDVEKIAKKAAGADDLPDGGKIIGERRAPKPQQVQNPLFRSPFMSPSRADDEEKRKQQKFFTDKRREEEERLLEAARKRREQGGGYKGGGFLGADPPQGLFGVNLFRKRRR